MECPKCESLFINEILNAEAPTHLEMNQCQECSLVFPTIQIYKWNPEQQKEIMVLCK